MVDRVRIVVFLVLTAVFFLILSKSIGKLVSRFLDIILSVCFDS